MDSGCLCTEKYNKKIECSSLKSRSHKKSLAASYAKYLSALILFGSNGVVASFIHLPSSEIVLLRVFLGSIIIVLISALNKSFKGIFKNKKDLFFVSLSGVFMGVSWLFQYEAYARIGISLTCILYCLGPILIVFISQFVFRESITTKKIICLIVVTDVIYYICDRDD